MQSIESKDKTANSKTNCSKLKEDKSHWWSIKAKKYESKKWVDTSCKGSGFSQSAQLSSLKILSWNYCGLGNPITVQRLKDLKKEFDPDIVFIMETKNPPEFVVEKLDTPHFEYSVHVTPHSPGAGGLSLFWNSAVSINVISTCYKLIDVEVSYKKKKFFATFTYGAPKLQQRRQILHQLTSLG